MMWSQINHVEYLKNEVLFMDKIQGLSNLEYKEIVDLNNQSKVTLTNNNDEKKHIGNLRFS